MKNLFVAFGVLALLRCTSTDVTNTANNMANMSNHAAVQQASKEYTASRIKALPTHDMTTLAADS